MAAAASLSPGDATPKGDPKDASLRGASVSMPLLDPHATESDEVIQNPMAKCRKRLREKRKRIQASLQHAVAENERGRREREAAHQQRLRRIAADNARRRHEEEQLLQKAARRELSFLKSLGIMPPPPRNRIRRSGKDGEAYATEDANYLVRLPKDASSGDSRTQKTSALPSLKISASEGHLHQLSHGLPNQRKVDAQLNGRDAVFWMAT
mmetsp:Transcript_35994/g.73948  ORF Transcript_35994/g.73948 Transcript_35994/m.73948 type:complete len:210 (+) Transcript_35994:28-657(+)